MPSHDPSDQSQGFDPNRHRKEIEQMERRFRERSERNGGGPVSTGEIDSRVADEMRQFFDASAQQLESVVPQLQEGERARAMAETTGEIRRKIDDFFAEAKEQGAGEAAPTTMELNKRRDRWVGMFPGQDFDKAAQQAQPQRPRTGPTPPPPAPRPRPAASPPPAPPAPKPAARPVAKTAPPAPARPAAPAARQSAPAQNPRTTSVPGFDEAAAADAATDASRMDLKTALEKLRRHGVVKSSDTASATRPGPTRPTSMPVPIPPAAPRREPAAQRDTTPPPRAPSQTQRTPSPAPRDAAQPQRSTARAPLPPVPPDPARREVSPARPAAAKAPPPAPARAPSPPPPPPPQKFSGRAYAAPPSAGTPRASPASARLVAPDRTGPIVDRPTRPRLNPALSDEDAAADPAPRRESPIRASRMPVREVAPPAATQSASVEDESRDPADSFDSIFDEVQSIVQDTLKVSIDESFAAAREGDSSPQPAAKPAPKAAAKPAPKPAPAPRPPADDPATAAARANLRITKLSRPEEDEQQEGTAASEEAPAEPYDWGVKSAPRPKGAWLLDTPDQQAEEGPAKTITTETSISSTQEPPAPPPSAGGARSYLVKKAGEEVKRFQPVLQALKDAHVLEDADYGERPASATASGGGDDEFMSAESFRDERPRDVDYEKELSPMQLVEEIRKLKRVTQALVIKGLISQRDLDKSSGGE